MANPTTPRSAIAPQWMRSIDVSSELGFMAGMPKRMTPSKKMQAIISSIVFCFVEDLYLADASWLLLKDVCYAFYLFHNSVTLGFEIAIEQVV